MYYSVVKYPFGVWVSVVDRHRLTLPARTYAKLFAFTISPKRALRPSNVGQPPHSGLIHGSIPRAIHSLHLSLGTWILISL